MRRFLTCVTATVLCAFVFLITLPFEAGARMVPQTTVLFDQVDDYDGRFFAFIGATNADNDPTVADDFVVPGGETWTISEVFIDGSYVALPDPSPDGDPICLTADIGFWNNGVDRPSTALQFYEDVAVVSDDNGKLLFTLTDTHLSEGTYWLSIQCAGGLDIVDNIARLFYWERNDNGGLESLGNPAVSKSDRGTLGYPAPGWNTLAEINGYGTGLDMSFRLSGTSTTSTAIEPDQLASSLELNKAYPNPFSQTLTIGYTAAHATNARIVVYDVLGRIQTELVNGLVAAGNHEVQFDGSNLARGSYFVVLTTADGNTHVENVLLN